MDEQARKAHILNVAVDSFVARNPDLAQRIHREAVLYGALTPETIAAIDARMDEESTP
jgi:hypothetical protein